MARRRALQIPGALMERPTSRAAVDADPAYQGLPEAEPEHPGPEPGGDTEYLWKLWDYNDVTYQLWHKREERRRAADAAEAAAAAAALRGPFQGEAAVVPEGAAAAALDGLPQGQAALAPEGTGAAAAEAAAANALAGLAEGRPSKRHKQSGSGGPKVHLATPELLVGAPKLESILLARRLLPWVHTPAGGKDGLQALVDEAHPELMRPLTYEGNSRGGSATTMVLPREASGPHHGATQYPFFFAVTQFFLYLLKGSAFYREGETKHADVVYLMTTALMTQAGLWGPFRRWLRHVKNDDPVPAFGFAGQAGREMDKKKIWAWVFNGQALPSRQEVGQRLSDEEKAGLVRDLWGWVEQPAEGEDEDEDEPEPEGEGMEE